MYINWVKSLVFLVAISVFGLFGCSNKENTGGSGDNFTIAFVAPTDPDDATVDRDWTEVAVSIGSALPTSSFIDFDHSLLAYLNFNGVAGSNAADLSSYGNAGTVEGGPQWVSGKFGSALSFDGIDDRVVLSNNSSLNTPGPMTIETWIKPSIAQEECDDPHLRNHGIISKTDANGATSWQLRYGAPDTCYLGFLVQAEPEGYTWVTVGQDLSPGEWHHVLAAFDGSSVRMYLNGVEADSAAISGIASCDAPVLVGEDGWGNFFQGDIDELRIHNRALSVAEILASYDSSSHNLTRRFEGLGAGEHSYYARATNTEGTQVVTETRDLLTQSSGEDTTAPVITLLGDNPMSLEVGSTYVEPGATATDDVDGDISADIIIAGDTVDSSSIGSYTVTYNVSDAVGNAAQQVTRTVLVSAAGSGTPIPIGGDDGLWEGTSDTVAIHNSAVLNEAFSGSLGTLDLIIPINTGESPVDFDGRTLTGYWMTYIRIEVRENTTVEFQGGIMQSPNTPGDQEGPDWKKYFVTLNIIGGNVTLKNPLISQGGFLRTARSGTHTTLAIYGSRNTGNITINGGIIEGGASNCFQGGRNNTVFNNTIFKNAREHPIYANGINGDGTNSNPSGDNPLHNANGLTFNYCQIMNPGVNFIYGQYGGHHEANHVQLRHYNNVTLNHCTISGEPSTIDGQYGLLGTDIDGLIVRDCTFRDYVYSVYSGSDITESKNWTFTNTNFITTKNSYLAKNVSGNTMLFTNCEWTKPTSSYGANTYDGCTFHFGNYRIILKEGSNTTFNSTTWDLGSATTTNPFEDQSGGAYIFTGTTTRICPSDQHAVDWGPIPGSCP